MLSRLKSRKNKLSVPTELRCECVCAISTWWVTFAISGEGHPCWRYSAQVGNPESRESEVSTDGKEQR